MTIDDSTKKTIAIGRLLGAAEETVIDEQAGDLALQALKIAEELIEDEPDNSRGYFLAAGCWLLLRTRMNAPDSLDKATDFLESAHRVAPDEEHVSSLLQKVKALSAG